MVMSVLACGVALRAGLALRRARRFRVRRPEGLREKHLRFAKPAAVAALIGFLGGPLSAILLRNWEPIHTFHGVVGLLAAALFAAAALAGYRLEHRKSRSFDTHALLGLLAMLAAVIASVAGFVLLP
jgi:cytochrome bd-type quinol oxidase subunit 2